jgi:lambda family phage minor tail protein L
MTITADLQSSSPGNLVVLYSLDTTPIGGSDVLPFFTDVNPLGNTLRWNSVDYIRFPIDASGFERTSQGTIPRPKLLVANIDGQIGSLGRLYGGLEGAKLTRTRTFLKYLDASNFPGGVNPSADPNQYIDREIWFIARRASENRIYIEYELAASFDLGEVKLPRRQIIQNVCGSRYRSPECGYTGGAVANQKDEATAVLSEDQCGKRLSSCKLRFGANAVLPYGGFPGAGLSR